MEVKDKKVTVELTADEGEMIKQAIIGNIHAIQEFIVNVNAPDEAKSVQIKQLDILGNFLTKWEEAFNGVK